MCGSQKTVSRVDSLKRRLPSKLAPILVRLIRVQVPPTHSCSPEAWAAPRHPEMRRGSGGSVLRGFAAPRDHRARRALAEAAGLRGGRWFWGGGGGEGGTRAIVFEAT